MSFSKHKFQSPSSQTSSAHAHLHPNTGSQQHNKRGSPASAGGAHPIDHFEAAFQASITHRRIRREFLIKLLLLTGNDKFAAWSLLDPAWVGRCETQEFCRILTNELFLFKWAERILMTD